MDISSVDRQQQKQYPPAQSTLSVTSSSLHYSSYPPPTLPLQYPTAASSASSVASPQSSLQTARLPQQSRDPSSVSRTTTLPSSVLSPVSYRHHAPEATPLPVEPSLEPVTAVTQRLLSLRGSRPGTEGHLHEDDIKMLCRLARPILLEQPMMLELEAPMKICGDVHGQYTDLLRLFEYGGFPPEANYLFLGDYVDRGKQSIETICLLLAYKIQYPLNFFILRGNHESAGINRIYGFYDECKRRYSIKLWKVFSDVFNCLPAAAVIDERILCIHGGLSPQLQELDQIADLERPCEVPDSGLLCDLLWSDPDANITGWADNDRGVSYVFGANVLVDFLDRHGLDLLVRAHQVVEDGYEFFGGRKLVTVFSAPNYCGEFDNAGGMITIAHDLTCSFQILKPSHSRHHASLAAATTATSRGEGTRRPNPREHKKDSTKTTPTSSSSVEPSSVSSRTMGSGLLRSTF